MAIWCFAPCETLNGSCKTNHRRVPSLHREQKKVGGVGLPTPVLPTPTAQRCGDPNVRGLRDLMPSQQKPESSLQSQEGSAHTFSTLVHSSHPSSRIASGTLLPARIKKVPASMLRSAHHEAGRSPPQMGDL